MGKETSMNIAKSFGVTALLGLTAFVAVPGIAQDVDLDNEEHRIAYSIGVNIGQSLVQQQLLDDIDFEVFLAGMRDLVNGAPRLSNEQMIAAIQTFQQRMIAQQQEEMEAARQAGQDFLAANAEQDGVVVLDSGLQYLVLESGDAGAPSPTASDSVLAHYHGTLVDGSVFDSSIERGEPAQFAVNQVIAGWTEALQLMKVGDKWRLFIPADLAYGDQGIPGAIPPFSTLIFDVELLEVR